MKSVSTITLLALIHGNPCNHKSLYEELNVNISKICLLNGNSSLNYTLFSLLNYLAEKLNSQINY